MSEYKYICDTHKSLEIETLLSPCRGRCVICNKKNVHGYTNPDHTSNPFGYLYLIPKICIECATKQRQCMWCNVHNFKCNLFSRY